jgi:glycosyltransferase involved in cell wall biosynthesis
MVMTSRFEGTPICALEAMILGVPIVSTPADGMADLVRDGENGFLAKEDGALAEKIALLLTDGSIRERMSGMARKKAAEYSRISDYRETLLRVYAM